MYNILLWYIINDNYYKINIISQLVHQPVAVFRYLPHKVLSRRDEDPPTTTNNNKDEQTTYSTQIFSISLLSVAIAWR